MLILKMNNKKIPNDPIYKQSKIYIISDAMNGNYVLMGYTTGELEDALIYHRNRSKNPNYNKRIYKIMREHPKMLFNIDLIEQYVCKNEVQLKKRRNYLKKCFRLLMMTDANSGIDADIIEY